MNLWTFFKKNILFHKPLINESFIIKEEKENIIYDARCDEEVRIPEISKNIEENLEYIEKRFDVPKNNDVIIRKFLVGGEKQAFAVSYEGMSDTRSIDQDIIAPLISFPKLLEKNNFNEDDVLKCFISHKHIKKEYNFDTFIEEVNFGSCGIFVDGISVGFSLDVKNWGGRGVEKPENEQSIYGPKEAFSEVLRTNSALIRKILKTEKLICEGVSIGTLSKTKGVLLYISDLANESLINEARRRLNGISMDYCIAIEEVSMLIEDKSYMITGKILSTERPDRVARCLAEGRVAFLLNGSPHALIFPTNAFELMHSASDAYLRLPFANMTRCIRLTAMGFSVLLPALYLAITLFHQEMIPTFLVYAISASRESVPFPSIVEFLLMDLSFEMIREAGIRMPNPLGATLGIVGGLILGQAAVSAKIVSPIMIIIIALTGIGSFATPDYSLGWTYRILRLIFVLLAGLCGFYGVGIGIFLYMILLGAQKSFGVPFLSPIINSQKKSMGNSLFVPPVWKMERRPEYLKTKKEKHEPKISMKWRTKREK